MAGYNSVKIVTRLFHVLALENGQKPAIAHECYNLLHFVGACFDFVRYHVDIIFPNLDCLIVSLFIDVAKDIHIHPQPVRMIP